MPSPSPSSSNVITPIQLLRSAVAFKRPLPSILDSGQPAVNINPQEPGLYFTDEAQSQLFKIGPCHVGNTAPNSTPATGGYSGNSIGESWLDTSNSLAPVLKVWDGFQWQTSGYIISDTIWVDPNGNDGNSGLSPQEPKKTIQAALGIASAGTRIQASPGNYVENNPLLFPYENISLIGAGYQNTTITIDNDADLFHVVNGSFISGFTFEGDSVTGKALVAFPSGGAGTVENPPVVENCVNNVQGSIGVMSDGSLASGSQTINVKGFSNKSEGGIGFQVKHKGFLNIENCETHFSSTSVSALSGGTAVVTNSKSIYGDYGLVSDGVSPVEQSGDLLGMDETGTVLGVGNLVETLRPYQGEVLTIGGLFYQVTGFEITNPGDGYTETPTIEISIGTGPNPIAAQGVAIIEGGQLVEIELLEYGQGYRDTDTIIVTISGGCPTCPASAEALTSPIFYTVVNSSEITGNSCVVEIAEILPYSPDPGDEVLFYRASKITAISHYMGYVGSGNDLFYEGGVPIPSQEAVKKNGGLLYFNSMDQSGNFKVGNDLTINQVYGTMAGSTFTNSVISTVTPYILSLS